MADLLELAQAVLTWAAPGEQVEVFASRARTTSVRAYQGQVEALTSAEPAGVGIRVIADRRQGFASAGTLDEAVLKETLAEARDNAAFATVDEWAGLAEPDGVEASGLDLCPRGLTTATSGSKVEMALELERLVAGADPRVSGVRTALYTDAVSEEAVATTTGVAAAGTVGYCYAMAEALARHGDDTQSGIGFTLGRQPGELDLRAAADEAVARATGLLGATKPTSRRVTAVLDPGVTASLLNIIGGTLSGEAVLKGRSLFANRVGELVAASTLTLVDDPTDPSSLGAEPYDGEGLARRRNLLIDEGQLCGYLYNAHSARRAGTVSTGSAVRGYGSTPGVGASALSLVPGSRSQDELIAEVGEGVLVESVSGLHSGVNPVSGDFSVGATGHLIRGGALAEPFREATIASTLQRMLLDVVALGADLRWFPGGAGAVSLVVTGISLGGS